MKPNNLEAFCEKIDEKFGFWVEGKEIIKGEMTIIISAESVIEVAGMVLDHFDYCHLSAITAQIRENQPDLIEVIYHFWCGSGLSFLMKVPSEGAEIPSIVSFLPGADFYEREVAEMFGIAFTGRSETPPLLLPDEWDQPPPFITGKENHE